MERVAEQQLALGRCQEPTRQLHQERAEPTLALERAATRHHHRQVGRDLHARAQDVAGEAARKPLEACAHVAALGVVVVCEKRLAVLAGWARLQSPRFAQSLVGELDPRTAGPLSQDLGGRLPEGAGLLGLARFAQQLPDGFNHVSKLR